MIGLLAKEMKLGATIAIVATMLVVSGFVFHTEIRAALTEMVDVKITQRTMVRLMNGNTLNDCMSAHCCPRSAELMVLDSPLPRYFGVFR